MKRGAPLIETQKILHYQGAFLSLLPLLRSRALAPVLALAPALAFAPASAASLARAPAAFAIAPAFAPALALTPALKRSVYGSEAHKTCNAI